MVNLISNEPKTGCYLLPILSNLQAPIFKCLEMNHFEEFKESVGRGSRTSLAALQGTVSLNQDYVRWANASAKPRL